MNTQDLAIRVKDHRTDGDEPEVRTFWFDSHREYLDKMKELTDQPQAHVAERTRTVLHIQPDTQKPLFADE